MSKTTRSVIARAPWPRRCTRTIGAGRSGEGQRAGLLDAERTAGSVWSGRARLPSRNAAGSNGRAEKATGARRRTRGARRAPEDELVPAPSQSQRRRRTGREGGTGQKRRHRTTGMHGVTGRPTRPVRRVAEMRLGHRVIVDGKRPVSRRDTRLSRPSCTAIAEGGDAGCCWRRGMPAPARLAGPRLLLPASGTK